MKDFVTECRVHPEATVQRTGWVLAHAPIPATGKTDSSYWNRHSKSWCRCHHSALQPKPRCLFRLVIWNPKTSLAPWSR